MAQLRVAVCDDDLKMRDFYADLIRLVAEKQGLSVLVDKYESGDQLLFALSDKKGPHDIVFLDIFMPGINGIDLGTQMRKAGYVGSIIFLTRSKDHMLPAFDVGATNYIVKGSEYEDDRFERVFAKAAQQVERRRKQYILLNGISEHRNVSIESIRYFEVSRHICCVHYDKDESFEFISSLGKIENTLLPFGFARVHKSFLVNCAAVKSYTFKQLVLTDETEIPIGRKYSQGFRQVMVALAEEDMGSEATQKG